jgi:hypothetical protein
MVFCGQCGYQLSPGETICPRCGAKTDADLIGSDPGTYNPTEISHAVIEQPQPPAQFSRNSQPGLPAQSQPRLPVQGQPPEPLILGSGYANDQLANEATTLMNSPTYQQQQAYANYPQQAGTGFYGYPQQYLGSYPQQYQGGQSTAVAQLLESSRRGKNGALLLILFGLLLLIGSIVILLLTLQGLIFTS